MAKLKGRIGAVVASLVLVVAALLTPSPVAADGGLGQPSATPVGTFGGIPYIQYDGIFEGQTSTGAYRVPYRITAPAAPALGNRTVLVEASHFAVGLGTLNRYLGRDFLFSRGFAHAGIGWSTTSFGKGLDLRILDPNVPGVFIKGGFKDGNGRTDDEIIADFGRALSVDPVAFSILGPVERRYLTGLSDASDPVLRLVTSGGAAGVFDFVLPFTAYGHDPQAAITSGLYGGKLMVVNSELEWTSFDFVDRGVAPNQYRLYAVAGAPHIPDAFVSAPFNRTGSTPASWQLELRAHFLQGDSWVRVGTVPPGSTHLKTSDGLTLDRDVNGNAISVDAKGKPVPRLPFVELGEGHFIVPAPNTIPPFLYGTYDTVKTIADLGFKDHPAYLKEFAAALDHYQKVGYILKEDADAMLRRAALCPDLTFTQTYRDHYDAFTAIVPCS